MLYWYSLNGPGQIDQVQFTAAQSGLYQIEVEGVSPATYHLAVTVSDSCALAAGAEGQISTTKTPRTQPVAQVSSEPPGQLAVPEAPPVSHSVEVYLPIILKGQRGGEVQVSTGQPSDVYLPIILK